MDEKMTGEEIILSGPHERLGRILERNSIPVPESGCHLWLGSLTNTGYGDMKVRVGKRQKHIYAHRAAAALAGFNINKKYVCHTCDVRSCINPLHLFVGDGTINAADSMRKRFRGKRSLYGFPVGVRPMSGKWQAYSDHGMRRHYLGVFSTLALAARAVLDDRASYVSRMALP